jgi:hypothetical protein
MTDVKPAFILVLYNPLGLTKYFYLFNINIQLASK